MAANNSSSMGLSHRIIDNAQWELKLHLMNTVARKGKWFLGGQPNSCYLV